MKAAVAAIALLAAVVALLVLRSGPDPGAVPTADEVAERTMSPFCEGLTLVECPHSKSVALRAQIEQMVAAGSTNSQIDAWMAANYGIVSQARPGGGLAWIVPPLLAFAGLITVFSILRSKPSRRPATAEGTSLSAEEEARFAADFQGYVAGSE